MSDPNQAAEPPNDDLEDGDSPKRLTPAKRARRIMAVVGVVLATGSWVYVRYVVPKSPLGGVCQWAMNCSSEAPTCMRQSEEGDGACSRPCDPKEDCAPGIRCVEIELEERDERGMPKKGGFCFPQSFIDARKARRAK